MRRHLVLIIALLSATVAPVWGQGFYIVGGDGAALRAPGSNSSPATPSAPGASTTLSILGGAGVLVSANLAVEGSIGMTTAQSIDWFYGYLFAENGDKRTDDRNVTLTGLFRAPLLQHRVISLEPVIGGGITLHRAVTFSTSDCGYGQFPTRCVTITPAHLDETYTTVEPILTLGVDLALRASRRVAIVPGIRFNYASRSLYLTGYDHRGPYSGSDSLWTLGATVRYSVR